MRSGRTSFDYSYRITVRNGDTALNNVQAVVQSSSAATQVIPARLHGHKDSGGRIEMLIERVLDTIAATLGVRALARDDISADLRAWLHDKRLLVIGGGSNLLLTGDFPGLVLHMRGQGIAIVGEDTQATLVRAAGRTFLVDCGRGVLLPPGLDEQWLVSVLHTEDDAQHYAHVFQPLTGITGRTIRAITIACVIQAP